MRHLLLAIVGSSAIFALPVLAAEQTVTMDIEKMSCAMCPFTVRKAMERVDGVQNVEVDFDSKTDASAVAQASTDVGYPATPVEETE